MQNVVVAVLVQVTNPGTSKTDPDHHASASMFDSWCNTLRNHPFPYSRTYKNPAWGTFKFWFISPHHLPVFSNPLAVFHGPDKPLFLILTSWLQWFSCSNSTCQLEVFSSELKLRLTYYNYCSSCAWSLDQPPLLQNSFKFLTHFSFPEKRHFCMILKYALFFSYWKLKVTLSYFLTSGSSPLTIVPFGVIHFTWAAWNLI